MTSSALLGDDRRGPAPSIAPVPGAGPQPASGTGPPSAGQRAPYADSLPAGLVPVAFSFRHRRVRLLDLSGVDCREHNFRATAERWLATHPDLTPVEMTWPEYLAAARQTPCEPLGGIVFNVARCGSTLLANILGALPGAVVLKESTTVALLIRQLLAAPTERERQELAEVLTATLPLYGRLAGTGVGGAHATGRVFLKPHSSLTVGAGPLLDLFPETPAIFLYRHPNDVVASMLAKPPYGGLYDLPREEVVPGFPSLADAPTDLTPAGFHAHLWRSPVQTALALPPERLLFLDYAELVTKPLVAISRLTEHLRIDLSSETAADTAAQMAAVMGVYAKDASGTERFDSAGTHRRPPLNAAQHADVQTVVGDLYAQLEARRQAQTHHP